MHLIDCYHYNYVFGPNCNFSPSRYNNCTRSHITREGVKYCMDSSFSGFPLNLASSRQRWESKLNITKAVANYTNQPQRAEFNIRHEV